MIKWLTKNYQFICCVLMLGTVICYDENWRLQERKMKQEIADLVAWTMNWKATVEAIDFYVYELPEIKQ